MDANLQRLKQTVTLLVISCHHDTRMKTKKNIHCWFFTPAKCPQVLCQLLQVFLNVLLHIGEKRKGPNLLLRGPPLP